MPDPPDRSPDDPRLISSYCPDRTALPPIPPRLTQPRASDKPPPALRRDVPRRIRRIPHAQVILRRRSHSRIPAQGSSGAQAFDSSKSVGEKAPLGDIRWTVRLDCQSIPIWTPTGVSARYFKGATRSLPSNLGPGCHFESLFRRRYTERAPRRE